MAAAPGRGVQVTLVLGSAVALFGSAAVRAFLRYPDRAPLVGLA